jgi:hypothetical protein
MKRTQILSVLGLLLVAATPAMAQNDECAPYAGNAANVCNASVDATKYFQPLLGLAISGGNPLIGSGRPLGGLGHFALGIRGTIMEAQLPDLAYDGSTPEVPAGEAVPFGAPTIDAAVGIFNGFGPGLLAIDVLGSVVTVPKNIPGLIIDPDASTIGDFAYELGYGVRVGVIRGGGPIPSISLSYNKRSTPKIQYGDVGDGDDYSYAMQVDAVNWRAVAGWSLGIIDLGVGAGKDTYTGDAQIQFVDPSGPTTETIDMSLDNDRTVAFGNLAFNLGVMRLGFEAGWQGAGDTDIETDFEDIDLDAGQYFGGVGFRIQF